MEALIKPETGLMFWTFLIFALLVLILAKTAWKPLMDAVTERERFIRESLDNAEKARKEAEAIKEDLETKASAFRREMEERLREAEKDAARRKESMLEAARDEAGRILEDAKKELEGEKIRLMAALKNEVAAVSLEAAEKILGRSVDRKTNEDIINSAVRKFSEN